MGLLYSTFPSRYKRLRSNEMFSRSSLQLSVRTIPLTGDATNTGKSSRSRRRSTTWYPVRSAKSWWVSYRHIENKRNYPVTSHGSQNSEDKFSYKHINIYTVKPVLKWHSNMQEKVSLHHRFFNMWNIGHSFEKISPDHSVSSHLNIPWRRVLLYFNLIIPYLILLGYISHKIVLRKIVGKGQFSRTGLPSCGLC